TVMGRGRGVLSGAQHTKLTPADVRHVIFEGFFPKAPRDVEPARGGRVGLHEMGLPYVSDPAITRHLAAFLKRHSHVPEPEPEPQPDGVRPSGTDSGSGSDSGRIPAAILFNGGVFQPASLRDRLLDVMHGWYDAPDRMWQPLVLSNPSLDLAV